MAKKNDVALSPPILKNHHGKKRTMTILIIVLYPIDTKKVAEVPEGIEGTKVEKHIGPLAHVYNLSHLLFLHRREPSFHIEDVCNRHTECGGDFVRQEN